MLKNTEGRSETTGVHPHSSHHCIQVFFSIIYCFPFNYKNSLTEIMLNKKKNSFCVEYFFIVLPLLYFYFITSFFFKICLFN